MIFVDSLWLIPAFPLLGAVLMLLFGRWLDPQHDSGRLHHEDHPHLDPDSTHGLRTIITFLCPGLVVLSFFWSLGAVFHLVRSGSSSFEQILFTWIAGLPFPMANGQMVTLSADWGYLLDPVSAVMILIVTGIGTIVHIYSIAYLAHDGGYYRYFGYLNLFLFFMLTLVLANNYALLFVGWEGVGLASYLLIGFYFRRKPAGDAAIKAFLLNRLGDAGFLLGIFFLLSLFGTLRYTEIHPYASPLLPLAAFCLFAAATGKSAQIPLFTWLPDAMEGPTPVSALIHAATMVTAGVYLLVRSQEIFRLTPEVNGHIAALGALTAIVGSTIALVQHDIKKVLAYSTVSQLGLMFVALGAGAYWVALFHVFTHAFFKAQLFLGAGSVIHALDGEQDMRRMGGLHARLPHTFRNMLIGSLALAGIPGLAGFYSKDEILMAAWPASPILFYAVLLTAALTAFYMGRLMFLTFFGAYRGDAAPHESPATMTVPLWVLSLGSVGAGWIARPFAYWLGAPAGHEDSLLVMLASTVAAAGGFAVAWWCYIARPGTADRIEESMGPFARVFRNRWYFDDFYEVLFVQGFAKSGGLTLGSFDRRVVDAAVDGAAAGARGAGRLSGWWDRWVVDGLVNVTALSVKLASFPMRLLQTGLVQTYAAVIVLSAAALAGWYLWEGH